MKVSFQQTGFIVLLITALLLAGCAGIGYVDETPCPDGSERIRHKPRHGPSLFICPNGDGDLESINSSEPNKVKEV